MKLILGILLGSLTALAQPPANQFQIVNAASGAASIAPGSIASAYGMNLAPRTESATSLPLPTSLGGIGFQAVDSTGKSTAVSLIYVSPTQINFVAPADLGTGTITFHIINGTGVVPSGMAMVAGVAPGIFAANGSGKGVALATAIRTVIPSNIQTPIPVFQCDDKAACVSVPIELGIDTPIYLSLYGTGFRNRSSLSNVSVSINGMNVSVLYAGPQPDFPGLDQINVPVVLGLRGAGETDVVVTVDGQVANTVRINVK